MQLLYAVVSGCRVVAPPPKKDVQFETIFSPLRSDSIQNNQSESTAWRSSSQVYHKVCFMDAFLQVFTTHSHLSLAWLCLCGCSTGFVCLHLSSVRFVNNITSGMCTDLKVSFHFLFWYKLHLIEDKSFISNIAIYACVPLDKQCVPCVIFSILQECVSVCVCVSPVSG